MKPVSTGSPVATVYRMSSVLNTVPSSIHGETRMAGTRTPSRWKSNPLPPGRFGGTTTPSGAVRITTMMAKP